MKSWTMRSWKLGALLFAASTIASGAAVAQTAPGQAQEPSCASMTGTARADCERAENAMHALCFGMSGTVRADCVKSYNPNRFRGQQQEATKGGGDTGMSGAATGTSGTPGGISAPESGNTGTTSEGASK
jgi:hypothetical protein